ncbi:MAG: hypothetical protein K8R19_10325 [Methanosarcinales archaeon]|nr:hypothetical protein [Methanosarcinales archaeon]
MNQKIMSIFLLGSFLLVFGATSGCIKNPYGASYRSDSHNLGIINKRRYPGLSG